MPSATRKPGKTRENAKKRAPQPAAQKTEATQQAGQQPLGELIQNARMAPNSLTQRDVLQLQRTLGNRAVSQMLTAQRRVDGVQRTVDSSNNVIQRVKGEDGEKKKGEDYCNNIGKSIATVAMLLPGFSNTAITDAIAIINENRSKCAVSTSLVKGPDTNTAAYSEFVVSLNAITDKISLLLNETDLKYAQEQVKSFGKDLMTLLDKIPTVAVDDRVAKVITGGEEGDSAALQKINAALIVLKDALKARFKEFLLALLESIKLKAVDIAK